MANSLFERPTGCRLLAVAVVCALAGGCAQAPMKPSEGYVRAQTAPASGSIPAPVQISAVLPKPKATPKPETYSVVVNGVNVHELLFAVARDAKLNIDIHPGITGFVTLNAIDQTLPQLLSRIAKQADLRWEIDGPNLIVMPDTPYLRTYRVDYVNLNRTVKSGVTASSQISTTTAGGGGQTSGTSIQVEQENLFWTTLVRTVDALLLQEDRLVTLASATRASQGTSEVNVSGQGSGQAGASAAGAAAAGTQQALAQQQAQASSQTSFAAAREARHVIANPDAGVLLVRAKSRVHEKVQEYLDEISSRGKRQVMIEATIAEVQLNNNYQQGIDWSLLRRGPSGISLSQAVTGTTLAGVNSSLFVGSIADPNFRLGNISATLRLLESFGNVRILSSPRISVLNNQTAVLKVVDNRIFFTIKAETTSSANVGTQTTFTTTPNVVAVGFFMNVTPQISGEGVVMLNLRPAISRILGFVNDPNPSLANPCGIGVANCGTAPIVSRLPEIQTREMESMIKVNSGQIAVMGGLIQDSITDNEDGVPGLNRASGFGALFTHRNLANTKSELVIFIRPVVVNDASIDGDFRALRSYLPDENFLAAPNPGKTLPRPGETRP